MRAFVDSLLSSPQFAGEIVHARAIPSTPPRWAEPRDGLSPALEGGMARLGVDRLYSHQAAALDLLRAGRDVAVVTPTASGKSLVNYLPTAEMLSTEGGHALYLFPHKALEQDQLKKLTMFGRGLFGARDLTAEIYDGDTPSARRRKIRAEPPDVLITNPDMLHMGLLSYHQDWARFFAGLRLVVIDELHVYRGVFGSHFAHVMRRLARIAAHYGAAPRYLTCSATVGNAAEFAHRLLGRPFEVVSEAGSPRSERHVLFVNPSSVSPYTAATRLFIASLRAGYRTIAFTKARRITELIHSWVQQQAPDLRRRVASYRAGYLPEERREIERRLFRGDLAGVVATSALELGIDVGGLDVCILVGYPGSIMSAWQRIGRVGRQDRASLVALVAQPDALDQYFMTHPDEFFTRSFETAVVDPENPAVSSAHIVCAGAEIALSRDEAAAYPGGDGVPGLLAAGRLVEDEAGERYYALKRHPQRDVSLRSGGASYTILTGESERERAIGSIDGVRVFHECHEGAVYLHAGRSFRVVRLDTDARRVLVVPFDGDYYTQALGSKETEILETHLDEDRAGYRLSLGRLKVTVRITEYARRRLRDQEILSKHPLELPPIVFETIGFWITLPATLAQAAADREMHFMGGLHGAEHAMISLFPLIALCDRSDVGGISYSLNPQLASPAIFIYDGYPGGIGIAAAVHGRIEGLLRATRELLEGCPCEEGCPSCVQSPKCGSGNRPLDKQFARCVLEHLTGEATIGALAAHSRGPTAAPPARPTGAVAESPGVLDRAAPSARAIQPASPSRHVTGRIAPMSEPVESPGEASEPLQDAVPRTSDAISRMSDPAPRAPSFGPRILDPAQHEQPSPAPQPSRGAPHPSDTSSPASSPAPPAARSDAQMSDAASGVSRAPASPPRRSWWSRRGDPDPSPRVRRSWWSSRGDADLVTSLVRRLLGSRRVEPPAQAPEVRRPEPARPGELEQNRPELPSARFAVPGVERQVVLRDLPLRVIPAERSPRIIDLGGARGGAAFADDRTAEARADAAPSRDRLHPHRVVFVDVETQRSAAEVGGWNRIRDMGLALAVVLDSGKERYTTFYEKDVERLMLELVMADLVVGYNTERFDLTVLSGYGDWDMRRIRSFDMLGYIKRRLGFRLKLGDLALTNLGVGKSADGLQSLAWYKEGRLDLIEEYCRRDVEVTARLYFLGRERGYLLFRNHDGHALRLAVDW